MEKGKLFFARDGQLIHKEGMMEIRKINMQQLSVVVAAAGQSCH